MKQDQFYLAIGREDVGSNAGFHRTDGKGYCTNLEDAHIYTRAEMQERVNKGWLRADCDEIPLSVKHVDALAVWHVDCQYVDSDKQYPNDKDKNNEYVAVKEQCWDGNDLGFASEVGFSFDYSKAKVFTEEQVNSYEFDGYYVTAKTLTDEVARRTFPWSKINRRKMIQGAGIIGVRKPRQRQSSGKERWNCPACGKINWQYNPYDFEGCKDINCQEHSFNRNELY